MSRYLWPVLCLASLLIACAEDSASESATSESNSPSADTLQSSVPIESEGAAPADAAGPFEMPVADVFIITGSGVVLTGLVSSGTISVGDTVCVSVSAPVKVTGIEMFRKVLETVGAGDRAGLLVENLSKDEVKQGDLVRSCE